MRAVSRKLMVPLATVLFGVVFAADPKPAAATHPDVDVNVEHLWVSHQGGNYVLDYEFADRGWESRMQGERFYVNLYLPGAGNQYRMRHAVPVRSHTGTIRFPAHLPYRAGWKVGIGFVIVDSGSTVRSGWVVRSPNIVRVHQTRYRGRGPSVHFRLNYHDRLNRYAWFGAQFGFRIGTHHGSQHHRYRSYRQKPVIIHRETHRSSRHHRPYYRRSYDDGWRDDDWRRRSEPSKRWRYRADDDDDWRHRRYRHRGADGWKHRGFGRDHDRGRRHHRFDRHDRWDRDGDRFDRHDGRSHRNRGERHRRDDEVRTRKHHRQRGHQRDDD